MNLIADNNERLSCIFRDNFSSLVLLPKIEKLINKQEPTLEDILGLCSDNASLLEISLVVVVLEVMGMNLQKKFFLKKGLAF